MIRFLGLLVLVLAAGALVVRFLPATNRPLLATAALSPYLMLGAPLAVLLFALSRHWTLVSIAAVLTVAVLAVQLPWYIGSPQPGSGATLRFVSANLLLGEAQLNAVATLARNSADILAVQELTPALAAALSPAFTDEFPYSALRPREKAAGVGLWRPVPDRRLRQRRGLQQGVRLRAGPGTGHRIHHDGDLHPYAAAAFGFRRVAS